MRVPCNPKLHGASWNHGQSVRLVRQHNTGKVRLTQQAVNLRSWFPAPKVIQTHKLPTLDVDCLPFDGVDFQGAQSGSQRACQFRARLFKVVVAKHRVHRNVEFAKWRQASRQIQRRLVSPVARHKQHVGIKRPQPVNHSAYLPVPNKQTPMQIGNDGNFYRLRAACNLDF